MSDSLRDEFIAESAADEGEGTGKTDAPGTGNNLHPHNQDPKEERRAFAQVQRQSQDIISNYLTWLTNLTIVGPNNDQPGTRQQPDKTTDKAAKPEAKDKAKSPEEASLARLPVSERVKQTMSSLLPKVNAALTTENENALAAAKEEKKSSAGTEPKKIETTQKALIDENKLKAEWAKGVFGPESRRAWQETCNFMNKEVIQAVSLLDARGFEFVAGCPVGPGIDKSGSGLHESTELFRDKLSAGQIQLDLGRTPLAAGELPTSTDIVRYINSKDYLDKTNQVLLNLEKLSQASYLAHQLTTLQLKDKPLTNWLKLEGADMQNASVEQVVKQISKDLHEAIASGDKEKLNKVSEQANRLEDWSYAVAPWLDPATQVRNYASTIASLNAVTRTRGVDIPTLKNLTSMLPKDFTTFPDRALQPGIFPGSVERNPDGTLKSVNLDLPDNLDRNNPINLGKIARLEKWLADYAPAVDKLMDDIALVTARQNNSSLLAWVKIDDIPHGSKTPNGDDYNSMRIGFDVQPCRKDGTPDKNGDFIKINSYDQYLNQRYYAYNGYNFWGSVQEVDKVSRFVDPVTREKSDQKIVHKNDYVRVLEGAGDLGRMKVIEAGNLGLWLAEQKSRKHRRRC